MSPPAPDHIDPAEAEPYCPFTQQLALRLVRQALEMTAVAAAQTFPG